MERTFKGSKEAKALQEAIDALKGGYASEAQQKVCYAVLRAVEARLQKIATCIQDAEAKRAH